MSKGVDIFSQKLIFLEGIYCFPPIPMIVKLFKHLQAQNVQCVLVIPSTNSSWVNLFFIFPFCQIDLEIQKIMDENFQWLIIHYANPQGGTDMLDKLSSVAY